MAPLPLMPAPASLPSAMQDKAMTLETTRRGLEDLLLPAVAEAVPIHLIASETDPALEALSDAERSWVKAQGWVGKQGSVLLLPDGQGGIGKILLGTGGEDSTREVPLLTGVLPGALPAGDYRFASPLPDPGLAALAFELSIGLAVHLRPGDEAARHHRHHRSHAAAQQHR